MEPKQDRVSRTPEAMMLGVSLGIVAAIALLSYHNGTAAHVAEQERSQAAQIVKVNNALLSALKDAETGQRGFLLTGREQYLEPYNAALANIPALLASLKHDAEARADLAGPLGNLEPLVSAKLAELKSTIDLRRANQAAGAVAVVETDRGKSYMDQIRKICGDADETAVRRTELFNAAARKSATNLRRVSVGGAFLLGFFLVLSTITIFHGMQRRDELFRKASASEKLLSTTLSSIADGVIATDVQGRITFINPVAQKLTGWAESEAQGMPIREVLVLINETTRVKVDNPLEKALAQGVPVGLANHTNLVSKTGAEIPIDDSAAPLKDDRDKVIGAVIVFRDISVRRRAEGQLRSANEEMQQFVNAAAHDLRAPLNSVNAVAQLMAEQFRGQLGPKGQEMVGYISSGLGRMKRLLDDLLAFARASHFDETTARPISLDGPFRTAMENLKSDVDGTGAEVVSEGLPVVVMHEAHALQLFQNLIGNSLKYHGAEAPRIQVRGSENGKECVICIADNGIGIAPEYAEQIFKPFKRLHGDDYPGSGIGLTACQKIVRGYGGRIWVEPAAGNGATFCFALPARGNETTAGSSG